MAGEIAPLCRDPRMGAVGRKPEPVQKKGNSLSPSFTLTYYPLNNYIRHDDAPGEQKLFHVAVAETKAEVQPDAMADDFRWKSVVLVGGGWGIHDRSMSH
jgi:hypothetical protein